MDEAASDALRPHLLASVVGLEHLWQEASSHVAESEPGTERWQRWREALDVVARALAETETMTAGVLPDLGRREWSGRPTGLDRADGAQAAG